jgi:hypothetical protein
MAAVCNVNDALHGHVVLDIECLDRIYLNAYVPNLQVGGQVVSFLTAHLGNPIPSPAIFQKIGDRFRAAVARYAEREHIPLVRFAKDDRKGDVVRGYVTKAARAGRPGVVAIGVAQEFQSVFTAYDRAKDRPGPPSYAFSKADRRVTCYYFYVWDRDFGPGFVKICSYFPYPAKVWINGHEWAKRQAAMAGIGFAALSNGFASCDDRDRLQAICDQLGPNQILMFFERWLRVVPTPLGTADRVGGYWWELSMRQIEMSRTLVLDAPRRARAFFEALVTDNLDLGRPDVVELIFAGRPARPGRRRRTHPETFKTKVVTRGVDVTVNAFYKHSRVKEYLKDGRALRVETVVNSPDDLGCQRRLRNLPELTAKARDVNARMLSLQRAGQGCAIETAMFERISQPYIREGQRTGALRFGDPRAMALAGALAMTIHTVAGFTNRSLRALVAGLLGAPYTADQMTYDLRRLRLKDLIRRLPRSNTYMLTPDGVAFAVFYTKVGNRLLEPLMATNAPPAPLELRQALRTIDHSIDRAITRARIKPAA